MKTKKDMLQGVKQLKKIHVSQLENKNQFLIIGEYIKKLIKDGVIKYDPNMQ